MGIPKQKLKIMVNDEKKFMPDTLLVKITKIYKEESGRTLKYRSKFYIDQHYDDLCDDSLNIPNFMTPKTVSFTTKIQVIWGGNKTIENFEIQIKPPFPKNFFETIGKSQTLGITLDFDPDIVSFPIYSNVDVKWTQKIDNISCDFRFCLRFFEIPIEFKYIHDFKCPLSPDFVLDRFNYFRTKTYISGNTNNINVFNNEYMAEIFQCDPAKNYSKLNLIVDLKAYAFELQIVGGSSQNSHKMRFLKINDEFQVKTHSGYSSKLFEVDIKKKEFIKSWLERSKFMLLNYEDTSIEILYYRNKEFSADAAKTTQKNYIINAYILIKDEKSNIEYSRRLTVDELRSELPANLIV